MFKPKLSKLFFVVGLLALPAYTRAELIVTDSPTLLEKAANVPYGWLKKDQLPPELQELVPAGCSGAYIESPNDVEQGSASQLAQEELVVEAQDASILDGSTAILQGDVEVSQGDRAIAAEEMTYERNLERATLKQRVRIKQPGVVIEGEYAEVSTIEHKATFDEAVFVFKDEQVRGGARSVKQLSPAKLELNGGYITTCEPGDETWMLKGEKITIDRETQQGSGKNVVLKVGKVPVFYLPYVTFPVGNERQSGFLYPSINNTDDGGADIAMPFYWNLAPNYDATITPRLITGRGLMGEVETRYLNSWTRTEMGFTYLSDDGGSQDEDLDALVEAGEITEEEARPHKGDSRWLVQMNQKGGGTHGWYTKADYTKVSDEDYFRDLGTSSLSVANKSFLQQYAQVGYQFENWHLSTLAQTQQVLLLDIPTPYRKLPQVDVNGRYNFGNWVINLKNRYTYFKQEVEQPDVLTGERFNLDYNFRWEQRKPWGFFVPEFGYKGLRYQLDANDSISEEANALQFGLGAPQASIDMGLVFEHAGGSYTQTIEPRAYWLYRSKEDHSDLFNIGGNDGLDVNFDTSERTFSYGQLYRDSRFIGGDRLDDANQVTLGLTSRWYDNRSDKELFEASVGQIFHFRDRDVTLGGNASEAELSDNSEIAGELRINLIERTEFFSNVIYDTETSKVNRGSTGIHYASKDYRKLVNLSYSFLRDLNPAANGGDGNNIDQMDFSFSHPLSKQWTMMARSNYDFENQQELESFVGFEYNDCCYRFRILARRWLDSNIAKLVDDQNAQYDRGIFFEVHLKGLGGSGGKANSILYDGIYGFEKREKFIH
ncbi:MAG: LPS-assembly protein LptD [Agarilytica sp.]